MNNWVKVKLFIILLTPVTMILNIVLKKYPGFVERYYSNGVDRPIRQILSLITSIFPTSAAEFLVITLAITLLGSIILLIIRIIKRDFINHFINILVYVSVLYVLFMVFWGFNYNRFSFDKIANLKIEKSSKQQLYNLCEVLVNRANILREKVDENSKGVMNISGGYRDVFVRAEKGYKEVAKVYPQLGGKYGPPKKILLSEKMCYTGITGIYMPYTGEANVNTNITDFMLPCTVAHEMAHQRGFAREDEANYIAYLTCMGNPDYDFQYSGIMLATIYSMNALADVDIDAYKTLSAKYSPAVRRDLQNDVEFWKRYKGKVEEVSNNMNNTYLKSNGQKDGVQSYGRMVDLLLAEYRLKIST